MSRSIHITADLEISSDTHQVTVISNKEEIGIAITGHSIPKLGISPFKVMKFLRKNSAVLIDQRVTVVFNQKNIYISDKYIF
jgi:hypothetical protein